MRQSRSGLSIAKTHRIIFLHAVPFTVNFHCLKRSMNCMPCEHQSGYRHRHQYFTLLCDTLRSLISLIFVSSPTQIVTYGFNPVDAPLELGGTHLSPKEFHDSMAEKNTVVIDVRNFNETAIGRFQPPNSTTELKVT